MFTSNINYSNDGRPIAIPSNPSFFYGLIANIKTIFIEIQTLFYKDPIQQAITHKNIDDLEKYLKMGFSLERPPVAERINRLLFNKCDSISYSLITAAETDNPEIVDWVLEHGLRPQKTTLKATMRALSNNLQHAHTLTVGLHFKTKKKERVPTFNERQQEQLEKFETKQEKIEKRKSNLTEIRERDPTQYPHFFDQILEYGYIQLFDHLWAMKKHSTRIERKNIIDQISVSDLSHIVLEARDAIIKKVESSVSKDSENVLFLLGGTGAGKSTTFNFLQGHKVKLTERGNYEFDEEQNLIIGHDSAKSCTFLPNIATTKDFTLVDFPGFHDTNEQLIELGIELALKALIGMYNPKILVIESITNNASRYEAVHNLRQRLNRLLSNPDACMLGLTKYSKNFHFIRMKETKKEYIEELSKKSPEELELHGVIETLQTLDLNGKTEWQQKLENAKTRLETLQKAREEKIKNPIVPEDKLAYATNELEAIENVFLKEIGLGKIVPLFDLEDPNRLGFILDSILSEKKHVSAVDTHTLSPEDQVFLKNRMRENLKEKIKTINGYCKEFENAEAFKQSVRDSSLVKTVFSHTNPEIGEFFHLPEMDPEIVREFDKLVIKECIKTYIKYTVNQIDVDFIYVIIEELRQTISDEQLQQVEEKLNTLQKYVLGLLGVQYENKEELQKKWKNIQRTTPDTEENPGWIELGNFLADNPVGTPYGIHRHVLNQTNLLQEQTFSKDKAEVYMNELYVSLSQAQDFLKNLKSLEKIIDPPDASVMQFIESFELKKK